MRTGSGDRFGSAASSSEARKRNHHARLGQVSFDEPSYKLAALAVESLGRLGKEGNGLIGQVAAGMVRGTDGVVPVAESRLQGTPLPDNLCDHSGRDFAQSSQK